MENKKSLNVWRVGDESCHSLVIAYTEDQAKEILLKETGISEEEIEGVVVFDKLDSIMRCESCMDKNSLPEKPCGDCKTIKQLLKTASHPEYIGGTEY